MNKFLSSLIVGAALLPASALARPDAAAAWVGGAFGDAEARDYSGGKYNDGTFATSTTTDNKDSGWRAFAGWGLGRYLGLELGYVDLGEASFSAQSTGAFYWPAGPVNGRTDADGLDLTLRGRIPTGTALMITVRGGGVRWSATTDLSDANGTTSTDDKGTSLVYGVGLELEAGRHVSIVADYTAYDLNLKGSPTIAAGRLGHHPVRLMTLGLLVPFGR